MVDPHLFDGSGGKRSINDRNVDTSLFKYNVRILQSRRVRYGKSTGNTFTTLFPSPAITTEFWSSGVELLEAGYDPVLEIDDVFRDLITKSYRHFVESEGR